MEISVHCQNKGTRQLKKGCLADNETGADLQKENQAPQIKRQAETPQTQSAIDIDLPGFG